MQQLALYTYFRSSAAYRVRIALNLKNIAYESRFVHLLKNGGEQYGDDYRQINPQQRIPALRDGEAVLTQSTAIIEYLEETHPEPSLLPGSAQERARIRAFAQAIACDIHPLDNLRVLRFLENEMGVDKTRRDKWYCHWIRDGFAALEQQLASHSGTGTYCFGDQVTLADVFLVPQAYNARRFDCGLEHYPTLNRIFQNCMELDAFKLASPEQQEDFE
jgi:maleylacetoacetate isomerase